MTGNTGGVLAGVRVVLFGRRIAAPLAAQLLLDQGADVVRIADRGGLLPGPDDPVLDAMLTRGQVEARLDLARSEAVGQVRRLVHLADVVLDDLPDAASRALWGLVDPDDARRANPGLIRCRIPAFPAGDPRSSLPDHEAVAGAAGGLFEKPLGPPRHHAFPLGSVMAGLFAGSAVVAALVARLRDGWGQDAEVSLLRSNYFAQILQVLMKTGIPRGFLTLRMVGTPFMRSWRCRDGRYIYLHITLPAHAARILDVLDEQGFHDHVRALRAVTSPETLRDPSQVKSIAEAKKIKRLYEQVFLQRTADEWERALGRELCCIKVRTAEEWLQDSMAAGMNDACEIADPEFGTLLAPGPGVTFEGVPWSPAPRRTDPGAFDDTLARWEATPPAPLSSPGRDAPAPPLDGLRVADMTRIIAGPCAGRVLAELGADVVSIQNPTSLDWALSFHLMFNAGKKSVTLDFTTADGRGRLWDILRDYRPDALLQNYRHLDVARAMGIGPEAVREAFPDIVYVHLNAYGNEGGWRDRPGFEQVVQAVSGIQMTYGGGRRPKLLPTPVIDIGSGLLGAYAATLGLYRRARTGRGAFAATHLTRVSVLFQLSEIAVSQRERCLAAARQRGAGVTWDPGREVVSHVVRTLDAWAVLAGPRGDVERLLCATDGAWEFASRRMWRATARRWQQRVESLGLQDRVVVLPVTRIRRLLEVEARMGGDLPAVFQRDYPGCPAPLTFVRSPIRLSKTPLRDVPATPVRGGHTREFLARVGVEVPEGAGVIPYPQNRPFLVWLMGLLRWGYFAWRSGNL